MSLERVVRPNQSRILTPPKLVATKKGSSSTDETVTIVYGKSWSVKTMNGSETLDVQCYCQRHTKEIKQPS